MNSISSKNISYLDICNIASINDDIFNTFKQNPIYTEILEHTSYKQGLLYLSQIQQTFPDYKKFLELFKLNDTIGSPKIYNYPDIAEISPSTLRYIKVLSDIKSLFPTNYNNKKIIEIGCGYGGQCLIFNQLFPNCEYHIVDLPTVQKLITRYLDYFKLQNYKIIDINKISSLEETYDLVISNYAYSELDIDLQDYYYDNIIKNSTNGYFTLNFISDLFNIRSYKKTELIQKFQKDKNISIIEEEPKTYNNNIVLYF